MPADTECDEECHTDEDAHEHFNADTGLAAVSFQPALHQHIAYWEGKGCCYHHLQYVFLEEHLLINIVYKFKC